MRQKGIEPFAQPWKGRMLPLHHWRLYTTHTKINAYQNVINKLCHSQSIDHSTRP